MSILKSLKALNDSAHSTVNVEAEVSEPCTHPILSHSISYRCIFANLLIDIFEFNKIDDAMKEVHKIIDQNSFSYVNGFNYESEKAYIKENQLENIAVKEGFIIQEKLKLNNKPIKTIFLSKEEREILWLLAESIYSKNKVKAIELYSKCGFLNLDIIKYYYSLCHLSVSDNKIIARGLNDLFSNRIDFNFDNQRSISSFDIYSSKGRKRTKIEVEKGLNKSYIVKSYDYTNLKVVIKYDKRNKFTMSKCYGIYEDIAKEALGYIDFFYIKCGWLLMD